MSSQTTPDSDFRAPAADGMPPAVAESGARQRVLLVTGYAGKSLDDARLAPGMELLRKPFTLDELVARVRALLKLAG